MPPSHHTIDGRWPFLLLSPIHQCLTLLHSSYLSMCDNYYRYLATQKNTYLPFHTFIFIITIKTIPNFIYRYPFLMFRIMTLPLGEIEYGTHFYPYLYQVTDTHLAFLQNTQSNLDQYAQGNTGRVYFKNSSLSISNATSMISGSIQKVDQNDDKNGSKNQTLTDKKNVSISKPSSSSSSSSSRVVDDSLEQLIPIGDHFTQEEREMLTEVFDLMAIPNIPLRDQHIAMAQFEFYFKILGIIGDNSLLYVILRQITQTTSKNRNKYPIDPSPLDSYNVPQRIWIDQQHQQLTLKQRSLFLRYKEIKIEQEKILEDREKKKNLKKGLFERFVTSAATKIFSTSSSSGDKNMNDFEFGNKFLSVPVYSGISFAVWAEFISAIGTTDTSLQRQYKSMLSILDPPKDDDTDEKKNENEKKNSSDNENFYKKKGSGDDDEDDDDGKGKKVPIYHHFTKNNYISSDSTENIPLDKLLPFNPNDIDVCSDIGRYFTLQDGYRRHIEQQHRILVEKQGDFQRLLNYYIPNTRLQHSPDLEEHYLIDYNTNMVHNGQNNGQNGQNLNQNGTQNLNQNSSVGAQSSGHGHGYSKIDLSLDVSTQNNRQNGQNSSQNQQLQISIPKTPESSAKQVKSSEIASKLVQSHDSTSNLVQSPQTPSKLAKSPRATANLHTLEGILPTYDPKSTKLWSVYPFFHSVSTKTSPLMELSKKSMTHAPALYPQYTGHHYYSDSIREKAEINNDNIIIYCTKGFDRTEFVVSGKCCLTLENFIFLPLVSKTVIPFTSIVKLQFVPQTGVAATLRSNPYLLITYATQLKESTVEYQSTGNQEGDSFLHSLSRQGFYQHEKMYIDSDDVYLLYAVMCDLIGLARLKMIVNSSDTDLKNASELSFGVGIVNAMARYNEAEKEVYKNICRIEGEVKEDDLTQEQIEKIKFFSKKFFSSTSSLSSSSTEKDHKEQRENHQKQREKDEKDEKDAKEREKQHQKDEKDTQIVEKFLQKRLIVRNTALMMKLPPFKAIVQELLVLYKRLHHHSTLLTDSSKNGKFFDDSRSVSCSNRGNTGPFDSKSQLFEDSSPISSPSSSSSSLLSPSSTTSSPGQLSPNVSPGQGNFQQIYIQNNGENLGNDGNPSGSSGVGGGDLTSILTNSLLSSSPLSTATLLSPQNQGSSTIISRYNNQKNLNFGSQNFSQNGQNIRQKNSKNPERLSILAQNLHPNDPNYKIYALLQPLIHYDHERHHHTLMEQFMHTYKRQEEEDERRIERERRRKKGQIQRKNDEQVQGQVNTGSFVGGTQNNGQNGQNNDQNGQNLPIFIENNNQNNNQNGQNMGQNDQNMNENDHNSSSSSLLPSLPSFPSLPSSSSLLSSSSSSLPSSSTPLTIDNLLPFNRELRFYDIDYSLPCPDGIHPPICNTKIISILSKIKNFKKIKGELFLLLQRDVLNNISLTISMYYLTQQQHLTMPISVQVLLTSLTRLRPLILIPQRETVSKSLKIVKGKVETSSLLFDLRDVFLKGREQQQKTLLLNHIQYLVVHYPMRLPPHLYHFFFTSHPYLIPYIIQMSHQSQFLFSLSGLKSPSPTGLGAGGIIIPMTDKERSGYVQNMANIGQNTTNFGSISSISSQNSQNNMSNDGKNSQNNFGNNDHHDDGTSTKTATTAITAATSSVPTSAAPTSTAPIAVAVGRKSNSTQAAPPASSFFGSAASNFNQKKNEILQNQQNTGQNGQNIGQSENTNSSSSLSTGSTGGSMMVAHNTSTGVHIQPSTVQINGANDQNGQNNGQNNQNNGQSTQNLLQNSQSTQNLLQNIQNITQNTSNIQQKDDMNTKMEKTMVHYQYSLLSQQKYQFNDSLEYHSSSYLSSKGPNLELYPWVLNVVSHSLLEERAAEYLVKVWEQKLAFETTLKPVPQDFKLTTQIPTPQSIDLSINQQQIVPIITPADKIRKSLLSAQEALETKVLGRSRTGSSSSSSAQEVKVLGRPGSSSSSSVQDVKARPGSSSSSSDHDQQINQQDNQQQTNQQANDLKSSDHDSQQTNKQANNLKSSEVIIDLANLKASDVIDLAIQNSQINDPTDDGTDGTKNISSQPSSSTSITTTAAPPSSSSSSSSQQALKALLSTAAVVQSKQLPTSPSLTSTQPAFAAKVNQNDGGEKENGPIYGQSSEKTGINGEKSEKNNEKRTESGQGVEDRSSSNNENVNKLTENCAKNNQNRSENRNENNNNNNQIIENLHHSMNVTMITEEICDLTLFEYPNFSNIYIDPQYYGYQLFIQDYKRQQEYYHLLLKKLESQRIERLKNDEKEKKNEKKINKKMFKDEMKRLKKEEKYYKKSEEKYEKKRLEKLRMGGNNEVNGDDGDGGASTGVDGDKDRSIRARLRRQRVRYHNHRHRHDQDDGQQVRDISSSSLEIPSGQDGLDYQGSHQDHCLQDRTHQDHQGNGEDHQSGDHLDQIDYSNQEGGNYDDKHYHGHIDSTSISSASSVSSISSSDVDDLSDYYDGNGNYGDNVSIHHYDDSHHQGHDDGHHHHHHSGYVNRHRSSSYIDTTPSSSIRTPITMIDSESSSGSDHDENNHTNDENNLKNDDNKKTNDNNEKKFKKRHYFSWHRHRDIGQNVGGQNGTGGDEKYNDDHDNQSMTPSFTLDVDGSLIRSGDGGRSRGDGSQDSGRPRGDSAGRPRGDGSYDSGRPRDGSYSSVHSSSFDNRFDNRQYEDSINLSTYDDPYSTSTAAGGRYSSLNEQYQGVSSSTSHIPPHDKYPSHHSHSLLNGNGHGDAIVDRTSPQKSGQTNPISSPSVQLANTSSLTTATTATTAATATGVPITGATATTAAAATTGTSATPLIPSTQMKTLEQLIPTVNKFEANILMKFWYYQTQIHIQRHFGHIAKEEQFIKKFINIFQKKQQQQKNKGNNKFFCEDQQQQQGQVGLQQGQQSLGQDQCQQSQQRQRQGSQSQGQNQGQQQQGRQFENQVDNQKEDESQTKEERIVVNGLSLFLATFVSQPTYLHSVPFHEKNRFAQHVLYQQQKLQPFTYHLPREQLPLQGEDMVLSPRTVGDGISSIIEILQEKNLNKFSIKSGIETVLLTKTIIDPIFIIFKMINTILKWKHQEVTFCIMITLLLLCITNMLFLLLPIIIAFFILFLLLQKNSNFFLELELGPWCEGDLPMSKKYYDYEKIMIPSLQYPGLNISKASLLTQEEKYQLIATNLLKKRQKARYIYYAVRGKDYWGTPLLRYTSTHDDNGDDGDGNQIIDYGSQNGGQNNQNNGRSGHNEGYIDQSQRLLFSPLSPIPTTTLTNDLNKMIVTKKDVHFEKNQSTHDGSQEHGTQDRSQNPHPMPQTLSSQLQTLTQQQQQQQQFQQQQQQQRRTSINSMTPTSPTLPSSALPQKQQLSSSSFPLQTQASTALMYLNSTQFRNTFKPTYNTIATANLTTTKTTFLNVVSKISSIQTQINSAYDKATTIQNTLNQINYKLMKVQGLFRWTTPQTTQKLIMILVLAIFALILLPFRLIFGLVVVDIFTKKFQKKKGFFQRLQDDVEIAQSSHYTMITDDDINKVFPSNKKKTISTVTSVKEEE